MRAIFEFIGWILITIGALVGILSSMNNLPPNPNSYNPEFVNNQFTIMVHAFTGLLFMILGPLQFVPPIRNKFINYHRWAGRIFLAASILVVFSSFVMVTKFPFAGLSEKTATFLFGTIFFVSIYQAYSNIKKRNIALHREWVIRVFSIGLGISMIRAFIGIFLAFTDYTQKEIFGLAFWGGFGSTLLVGEIWIRATRKRKALSSEKSIS